MNITIQPSKSKSAYISLTNDSDESIALELSATTRVMNVDGTESKNKRSDNFLIFPSQLVLKANQKRKIKIKLMKADEVKTEQSYRIIAEQLPIKIDKSKDKKQNGIKILLRYVGALYVTPVNTKAKVEVTNTEVNNKTKNLKLTVKNSGTKHQVLKNLKVIIKTKKDSITLKSDDLKGMTGENMLSGNTRIFNLKLSQTIKLVEDIKVELDFDKE